MSKKGQVSDWLMMWGSLQLLEKQIFLPGVDGDQEQSVIQLQMNVNVAMQAVCLLSEVISCCMCAQLTCALFISRLDIAGKQVFVHNQIWQTYYKNKTKTQQMVTAPRITSDTTETLTVVSDFCSCAGTTVYPACCLVWTPPLYKYTWEGV